MRIIGGKYLNWGSEAIRLDTGMKMEMVRVKDGDMTRLEKYTLLSVMLMFRASCDLEVKNTPPGSPTGIVFAVT
jgi:hypothetical protein